ncbi:MAG: type I-C CRISPR-associated protein Cas8c/Csd1 [Rubritalea sp.]|uniref:type I-C CRISPR-associated protein Cas8c/Csd1 n=1 Tax=Rubritalea sp. TaxID=2109375 RepID=UPI00324242D7
MILQSLYKLYDRLADDPAYEIAKPGYAPQQITFRIILKPSGELFDITDARLTDAKGKLRSQQRLCLGFEGARSSGIKPYFLCDKSLYSLGYDTKEKDPVKLEKKFTAFRDKLLNAETQIDDSDFSSVCKFLRNWSIEKAAEYLSQQDKDDFLQNGFGYFEIQGATLPIDQLPKVKSWWDGQQSTSSRTTSQCLITGENAPIARLHSKIKGVVGGQAEQSLVSFNDRSYDSYCKDQSFNAPVSEQAAFKYSTALNSLLNGPKSNKHRIRICDTTCVFWTEQPSTVEDAASFFFSDGSNTPETQDESARSKVEIFLKSLHLGTQVLDELGEDTRSNHFYILGLAPNAARLSVRFFHQSTIAEFVANLRAHHDDISIIRQYNSEPELPSNSRLLEQTATKRSSGKIDYDTIPPLLAGSLMRAVLDNTPYPEDLYSAVLRRIRADRTINYFRASVIKGVLTRNHKQTMTTMLDIENKEPAYLLGRLFSALEKTQGDALGDLNAGLKDKFYSSASATPASVFPRILRTYPHHLAKLNGGQKVVRERLIQDIIGELTEFPSHLNLKDQGKFAIGYYHQRKALFTKKSSITSETQESK